MLEQTTSITAYNEKIHEFLHNLVADILQRWLKEAEEKEEILTSSMVYGYLAILWTSLKPNEINASNMEKILSSLAFVSAWI